MRSCLPAPLALLGLLLPAPLQAPLSPRGAAQAFGELEEVLLADGGELWGVELLGPLLLAEPGTRAVVANQPDERDALVEREGVFVGRLPAEVGVANTALEWSGVRWTMVMWPLPSERHARLRLLAHESFHRIQPGLGHGGGDRPCAHLDTRAGRTWLRLEFRALARALRASAEQRRAAAADALLFRSARRALFPEAAALEAALERNEGLAEYTGFALCGLRGPALAEEAARKLQQDERAASFVRSFAYASGPAYGLLLDEQGGDWRARLGPRSDLAALLADALAWHAPSEPLPAAEEAAARYEAAALAAEEDAREEERARREQELRARFVSGPTLTLPLGGGLSYSFDPGAVTPLAGLGSVYGTLHAADEWGVLEAGGGALLVLSPQGQPLEARVSAPEDAHARPLAGAGWTLALAEGWRPVPGPRAGDWRVVRAP